MCECKLILCAFFVCNVVLVTSFNIDQLNYAVYGSESGTMFGFTVAVHKDRGNRGWVLVGAPSAQSRFQIDVAKGGAVYKCRTETDDNCEEVPFDKRSNAKFGTTVIDDKSGQWFGATLSTSGAVDGPVVACAPRYVWFTKERTRRDPVGTCIVSNGAFDNFEEYSPCRTMNWGYHRQGSCQAGFSAAINRIGDRLYVGAPGSYYWQGQMYSIDAHAQFNYTPGFFAGRGYGAKGSVHQQSLETRPAVFSTREGSAPDDDSYMGYSTVVGHFRGEPYEGIAVGMPRGNKLKGKVLLFTWDLVNYKNISISKQIGSYFGYSLTAADVNGDGLLDIIVGAPIHTESNNEGKYDVGRVYVFYQSSDALESYTNFHYLDGINTKGRFGHAVASLKDLNQDGYEDFAVGAPYDGPNGRGAVYIFYGSKDGTRKKHGQVIYAEAIQTRTGGSLSTFGFSISGGMDLDGNEYPDMAVGSYLSDTAFFFRSRPVVVVDGFVRFQTPLKTIDIKNKDCILPNGQQATCTAIDFCIKYSGKGIPDQLYLTVQYILDSKKSNTPRMAFKDRGSHTFKEQILLYKDGKHSCKTQQVYIKNDIRDKLTHLEAEVKYFMTDDYDVDLNTYRRDPRSQLKPVIDLNNPPSKKDSISIQKNCGSDNICTPNLHVNISTIEKYLLGSGRNLELDVTVTNFGEDSFETTFQLHYPDGIHFGKVDSVPNMPSVLCSNPLENKTIDCDIGNPLPGERIITFKLILQPYHEEGMPSTYEFDAYVNNSNPGVEFTNKTNHKHISVIKWVDATLELEGSSYPPVLRYNESSYKKMKIEKESDIGPQVTHVYYLTNKGPADIEEAEILLMWPSRTLGGEYLLYLLDQPHTKGNVKCQQAAANAEMYKLDIFERAIWERLKIDTSESVEGTSSTLTQEKEKVYTGRGGSISSSGQGGVKIQTETGRGVSSGEGVVNRQNIDNENLGSGDGSLFFERRHNITSTNSEGSINSLGEYTYVESKRTRVQENGRMVERWQNKTIVKDANGNIIRTYYSNDWDGLGEQRQSQLTTASSLSQREEEERIRQEYLKTEQNRIREQQQLQEKRRLEEEARVREDARVKEQARIDEMRAREEARLKAETRRKEEKRLQEEAQRNEEIRTREEARLREERKRQEEERRQQEEWIRTQQRQQEEEERRRLQAQRTGGVDRDDHRRLEEQRRREEELRKQDDIRREEEWRKQVEQRRQDEIRRQEAERIRTEEWRREQEKIRRLEEEKRRQQSGTRPSYYPSGEQSWGSEEERRRQQESSRSQSWNRSRAENSYILGGGEREGGGSQSQSSIRGYYDERGVFHPTGGTYNFSFTVEHSTTIPLGVSETGDGSQGLGLGESDRNGVFRFQTLDLGTVGGDSRVSGSSSSSGHSGYDQRNYDQSQLAGQSQGSNSGSYSREWSSQGGYSRSGQIPPTYFQNTIEDGDNVGSNVRNKRQSGFYPKQVIETFPCNSTQCIEIRCTVGKLAKNEEIAIALRSRLNVRAVNQLITQQPVKISSMMKGTIRKLPYLAVISDAVGLDDKRKKEVFTEIAGKEPELVPEVAPLWIYVVSAVAGTVMLLLLIWILSKCGFFKRNRPSSAPERQPLNRNGYHHGDEAL